MGSAIRFKHTDVGRQQGEMARLKVTQGPDSGAVYIIMGPKATIGRGDENDVVISDLKASRIHAEMVSNNKSWIIRDRGSANGILYNGVATREAKLKLNDLITLGETTLEFTTSDVGTILLVAPPRTSEQIEAERRRIAEIRGKNAAMGMGEGGKPFGNLGNGNKNRILLWVGGAAAVFYLMMGDSDKPRPPPKKKPSSNKQDLATYLPQGEKNKVTETLFKDGFREYLAGNYSRARTQFETVLQIMPSHNLATIYLENCNKSVENSVKHHLEKGKRALHAGKLREAKAHFERVLQLLFRDQTNPAYIESKEQLDKVQKEMNDGGGG